MNAQQRIKKKSNFVENLHTNNATFQNGGENGATAFILCHNCNLEGHGSGSLLRVKGSGDC